MDEIKNIEPTYTHKFIADLEQKNLTGGVITQNIDGLHQRAGSKKILEIHGSFWKNYCMECGSQFSFKEIEDKIYFQKIPRCSCGGVIKPDIVFFGQPVKYLQKSRQLAVQSDLFIVIGSSLTVHPVASLPGYCNGKITIVNKGRPNFPRDRVSLYENSDLDIFFKKVAKYLK